MPGFDRRGPLGKGPMTGRGLGPCGTGKATHFNDEGYGVGRGGRPWGGGNGHCWGGGRGHRHGFQAGMGRQFRHGFRFRDYTDAEMDIREEMESYADYLKNELDRVEKALSSGKGKPQQEED